jgi:hypothetical protein
VVSQHGKSNLVGKRRSFIGCKKNSNKALIIKFDTFLKSVWENWVFGDIEQKLGRLN